MKVRKTSFILLMSLMSKYSKIWCLRLSGKSGPSPILGPFPSSGLLVGGVFSIF